MDRPNQHTIPRHFRAGQKSPGVRPVGANIGSLANIGIVVGKGGIDIIPPGIRRGGAGTAGIFPLGFGGQDIGPARGQVVCLLLVQALQKDLNIVPTDLFHR